MQLGYVFTSRNTALWVSILLGQMMNFQWAKPVVMELFFIRMSRSFAAKRLFSFSGHRFGLLETHYLTCSTSYSENGIPSCLLIAAFLLFVEHLPWPRCQDANLLKKLRYYYNYYYQNFLYFVKQRISELSVKKIQRRVNAWSHQKFLLLLRLGP